VAPAPRPEPEQPKAPVSKTVPLAPKKEEEKSNKSKQLLIVLIAVVVILAGLVLLLLLKKSDKPVEEPVVIEEVIDTEAAEVPVDEVQGTQQKVEPETEAGSETAQEPEQKPEPKVEKKPEPKVEQKLEPKEEKKTEPKSEPKAEQKQVSSASAVGGLKINGELFPSQDDLNPKGGELTARITLESGSSSDCTVKAAGDWYTAVITPSGDLKVTYMKNATDRARSGEVEVLAGKESVKLIFTQQALPNQIESDIWTSRIRSILAAKSEPYDNGDKYRGDLVEDVTRTGLGIYMWSDGTLYYGGWDTDMQDGKGVYSMPSGYTFAKFKKCRIIVGDFDDNAPSGRIACYDAKGRLIYDGAVQGWSAVGTYPSPNPSADRKFEYIEYSPSEYYIGETLNGKRHGYGLYKSSDGTCWIGTFSNGQKSQGKAI